MMKFFLPLGDPVVHRYLLLMMRVHSRHAAAPSGCRGNACYSYILFHLLMLGLHVDWKHLSSPYDAAKCLFKGLI